jgi:YVTN family beta-propeller protein
VSADDLTVVVANRDVGTITVFAADYQGLQPELTPRAELSVGGEPWQVVIDGCGSRAYVIARSEQKVIAIDGLDSVPMVVGEVAVGSEPTGLVLSPNNTQLFVANWVDGTVSVVDTETLQVASTIDLNGPLAGTGLLGPTVGEANARPALAHPRSLAMTNDGDGDDSDETLLVTEFFAQRTAPEASDGSNVDSNWAAVLYRVEVATLAPEPILLRSKLDVGFAGAAGTGCFPNQLQSVTVHQNRAYVTSICASPKGPTNPKQMTHPALSVVDLATTLELDSSPIMLDGEMVSFYDTQLFADDASRRMPLLANDLAFTEEGVGLIPAGGVDAVFGAGFDQSGQLTQVGFGATRPFLDLSSDALPQAARGESPIGLATAHAHPFAYVANQFSRNLTVLAVAPGLEDIAGASAGDPKVYPSTLPATSEAEVAIMAGRRAFESGLGRFSLNGQGWGACASCHFEGLSDNVTWYFGRGPRQSTSLDGSYSSSDPSDQRIFNWTAVADEMADFEGVLRGLDGGVGAIVHTLSNPPVNSDRVDLTNIMLFPSFGAGGLNGSARLAMEQQSLLQTWAQIEQYVKEVRSPRAPSNLDPVKIQAGEELFVASGGCAGCHGGAKWTLSTLFYTPSSATNESLKTAAWNGAALIAAGFPEGLLPAPAGNQVMRSGSGLGDVMQCALRPVGTFGVSPSSVNAIEVRQDMLTTALGNETVGKGFNVPSLLGAQVGAPYFHAGNARTLEELLKATFATHRAALADAGFLSGANASEQRDALVHYLLSIDETTVPVPLPAAGASGGDFCALP